MKVSPLPLNPEHVDAADPVVPHTSLAAPALTTPQAVTASMPAVQAHPQPALESASAAVPAAVPSTDLSSLKLPLCQAAPALQTPQSQPPKKTLEIPERTRKWNLLFHKADRISENFTMNYKIANSNCQHQIEDLFWKVLEENQDNFFTDDEVDYDKIKEAYKSSARSLGVRIY